MNRFLFPFINNYDSVKKEHIIQYYDKSHNISVDMISEIDEKTKNEISLIRIDNDLEVNDLIKFIQELVF